MGASAKIPGEYGNLRHFVGAPAAIQAASTCRSVGRDLGDIARRHGVRDDRVDGDQAGMQLDRAGVVEPHALGRGGDAGPDRLGGVAHAAAGEHDVLHVGEFWRRRQGAGLGPGRSGRRQPGDGRHAGRRHAPGPPRAAFALVARIEEMPDHRPDQPARWRRSASCSGWRRTADSGCSASGTRPAGSGSCCAPSAACRARPSADRARLPAISAATVFFW